MGVWAVTVGGDNVTAYVQFGLSMQAGINQRPNVRMTLRVRDGVTHNRPEVRDTVEITDSAVSVFRGIVWSVKESPIVDDKHREYALECVGYQALADVVLLNGIVGPGTLESMLNEVVTNLLVHGIQVDPSQVTGPTLTAMGFNFATITQCLDALAGASGYNVVWTGEYVRLEDPGTVGAPFALDESNSTICGLEHTRTLANYINEVWVIFGDSSIRDVTDGFTGDGSTKTFPLHYIPAVAPGNLTENGTTWAVGVYGVDTGYRWYYRSSDQALVVDAALSAPANGHIILVPFTAQFPGAYFVRDATGYANFGPWTMTVSYPDIFEWSQAAYAANWELDRHKGTSVTGEVVRRVRVKTFTAGLESGMTVNITATNYDLSSTSCLITSMSARQVTKQRNGNQLVEYTVEALEGTQYQQNWLEYFRKLNVSTGAGASGSVVSGGTSSTSTTVRGAFWGGSREFGDDAGAWRDVFSWLPVRIDGTSGVPTTVRVDQKTDNAGTSVQVRIVKVSDSSIMATGAASTSTSWDEELLTFTPDTGANDYKLQFTGSNTSAQVYAIGQSL
jgi:hypothetical protein